MPRSAPYGFVRHVQVHNIPFTNYLSTTTAFVRALSKSLGYEAELEKVEIVCNVIATGAGASRVINVRKGSATGTIIGTITALLADGATLGTVKVGTITTGGTPLTARLLDSDTLTIELPTGGTVFTAGSFDLLLTFRSKAQRSGV